MTNFRDVLHQNKNTIEIVARQNSHVNEDGHVTISKTDPWADENEWDAHYKELTEAEHGARIVAY